jgi:hypothetical protein
MKWTVALSFLLVSASLWAATPAPQGAEVYFVSPQDGETVSNPVTIRFGLKNMGVAPAGVERENTGHHHLVIDAELPPATSPIPSSENYVHFGAGQTETTVEMKPGKHTLQLVLGDHLHVPFDPVIASGKITITVE